jgi:hypothetical protein
MNGGEPQGLKPGTFGTINGTAEAVPLHDNGFLQPALNAK